MKRTLKIMKAPTGWGKSHRLRNLARYEPVILAIPTHAIAREQYLLAKEEGIYARYIRGRRLFVCGRKLADLGEEERREIEKYILPDGEISPDCPEEVRRKISQDYLCCRRQNCTYDPFRLQFEGNGFPDLLITTHAFLFLSAFLEGADYIPKGWTLAIDEADLLLSELGKPRAFVSSLSLKDLTAVLNEIRKDLSRGKREANNIIRRIEKTWSRMDAEGMFFLETGSERKKGDGYSVVNEKALVQMRAEVEEFISLIPRGPSFGGYREFLFHVRKLLSRVLSPEAEGEYSWVSDKAVGVSRLIFSPSSWTTLNAMFSFLEPKEVILATATLPRSLLSFFPQKRWEIEQAGADPCEVPFPDSDLYVVVGNRDYDYERVDEYRKYAVRTIERFTSPNENFVILATSFADIEFLREALEERGYRVVAQTEDLSGDQAVEVWKREQGVLVGNVALWRGLNIKEVDKFFIFKLPFASPGMPKFQALSLYQQTKGCPVSREEAKNLFAQGVGRVVRENGVRKFLFVLDGRLKRYHDFLDVFKEVPCPVYFLELEEENVEETEGSR